MDALCALAPSLRKMANLSRFNTRQSSLSALAKSIEIVLRKRVENQDQYFDPNAMAYSHVLTVLTTSSEENGSNVWTCGSTIVY